MNRESGGTDGGRQMFPSFYGPADRPKSPVANWAVIGIFLILAFQMLATARAFLMPVALGVLLFFVFVPFRRFMDRRGLPPAATAGLILIGIVASIGVLGWFISGPAGDLIDDAPRISQQLKQKYEDFRQNLSGIEKAAEGLSELTGAGAAGTATVTSVNADPATGATTTTTTTATTDAPATLPVLTAPPAADGSSVGQTVGQPPSTTIPAGLEPQPATTSGTVTASSIVTQPLTDAPPATNELKVEVAAPAQSSMTETLVSMGPAIVSQLFFTLIFLFFLLASGDLLYLRIVQSFDSLKEKRAAYNALRQIEASLGNYLGAITIINVGLGVVSGLAMWAWGMPSPLLWGIAAAVLNFIPYIGAALGYIGAFVVALVVFDDVWRALLIGGTYFALTAFEGQFITPYFVSRRLQLNTVVVFLTVALWAWLWSIVGMVVAVPMLVVIRVLADHIPGLEKFGNFLAGEDPPEIAEEDRQIEGGPDAGPKAGPATGPKAEAAAADLARAEAEAADPDGVDATSPRAELAAELAAETSGDDPARRG